MSREERLIVALTLAALVAPWRRRLSYIPRHSYTGARHAA